MQSVKFETRTSEYELSQVGDDLFSLKKLHLKPGHHSSILPGEEYHASRNEILLLMETESDQVNLVFGHLTTSPIEKTNDLYLWIKENTGSKKE